MAFYAEFLQQAFYPVNLVWLAQEYEELFLEQYGESQITFALKRSIWKDITHNVSDYYIYYNNHWYIFNEDTQDAVCPVPAFIDYWCETMKGYYRTSQS